MEGEKIERLGLTGLEDVDGTSDSAGIASRPSGAVFAFATVVVLSTVVVSAGETASEDFATAEVALCPVASSIGTSRSSA